MSKRDDLKLAARSLVVLGHKEGMKKKTYFPQSKRERQKYCSMTRCDQTCDGEVGILEQFLDRRRHLHLQQPGKNDTTGTDDGNGKNEYCFHEPSATLHDSRTIVDVF